MDWRLSLDCLHSRDFVFYHLGHCTICLSNSKEINTCWSTPYQILASTCKRVCAYEEGVASRQRLS